MRFREIAIREKINKLKTIHKLERKSVRQEPEEIIRKNKERRIKTTTKAKQGEKEVNKRRKRRNRHNMKSKKEN